MGRNRSPPTRFASTKRSTAKKNTSGSYSSSQHNHTSSTTNHYGTRDVYYGSSQPAGLSGSSRTLTSSGTTGSYAPSGLSHSSFSSSHPHTHTTTGGGGLGDSTGTLSRGGYSYLSPNWMDTVKPYMTSSSAYGSSSFDRTSSRGYEAPRSSTTKDYGCSRGSASTLGSSSLLSNQYGYVAPSYEAPSLMPKDKEEAFLIQKIEQLQRQIDGIDHSREQRSRKSRSRDRTTSSYSANLSSYSVRDRERDRDRHHHNAPPPPPRRHHHEEAPRGGSSASMLRSAPRDRVVVRREGGPKREYATRPERPRVVPPPRVPVREPARNGSSRHVSAASKVIRRRSPPPVASRRVGGARPRNPPPRSARTVPVRSAPTLAQRNTRRPPPPVRQRSRLPPISASTRKKEEPPRKKQRVVEETTVDAEVNIEDLEEISDAEEETSRRPPSPCSRLVRETLLMIAEETLVPQKSRDKARECVKEEVTDREEEALDKNQNKSTESLTEMPTATLFEEPVMKVTVPSVDSEALLALFLPDSGE